MTTTMTPDTMRDTATPTAAAMARIAQAIDGHPLHPVSLDDLRLVLARAQGGSPTETVQDTLALLAPSAAFVAQINDMHTIRCEACNPPAYFVEPTMQAMVGRIAYDVFTGCVPSETVLPTWGELGAGARQSFALLGSAMARWGWRDRDQAFHGLRDDATGTTSCASAAVRSR